MRVELHREKTYLEKYNMTKLLNQSQKKHNASLQQNGAKKHKDTAWLLGAINVSTRSPESRRRLR
jgi:hypothetical protein